MTITLLLGGARSGKSARAQNLAEAAGLPRIYIATAEARDGEMVERIARHRAERDKGWTTIEAPLNLVYALHSAANAQSVVLVDCLTLWLSNLMEAERDLEMESAALAKYLKNAVGEVILVSNEVGLGLVPDNALGRAFRDAQGRLNQRIAAAADVVEFVAAGLPLRMKG